MIEFLKKNYPLLHLVGLFIQYMIQIATKREKKTEILYNAYRNTCKLLYQFAKSLKT